MTARRFPPPWTIEDSNGACFIVRDHNGFAVAYVYYEAEPGRRTAAISQLQQKKGGRSRKCGNRGVFN